MGKHVDDAWWDFILEKLTLSQLHEGRQKIDQAIKKHETPVNTTGSTRTVSEGYEVPNSNRDTFSSTASTLNDRSTPRTSLTCGNPVSTCESREPVKRLFFCTFCAEAGIKKTFGTKHDWKRHEGNFHTGTGLEWRCGIGSCPHVADRGQALTKHVARFHPGNKHLPPPTQLEWLYGCGFKKCRIVSSNWKERCNHVARCMQRTTSDWDYSQTIRNLLEDDHTTQLWAYITNSLDPSGNMPLSAMQWEQSKTRKEREKLESQSFGLGSEMYIFFQNLFRTACHAPVSDTIQVTGHVPTDITAPSTVTSMMPEGSYASTSTTPLPYADTTVSSLAPLPILPMDVHQWNAASQLAQYSEFAQLGNTKQPTNVEDLNRFKKPNQSFEDSYYSEWDKFLETFQSNGERHFGGASPFIGRTDHFNETRESNQALPNNRFSIQMMDAPDLVVPDDPLAGQSIPESAPFPEEDLIRPEQINSSLPQYSINNTPPLALPPSTVRKAQVHHARKPSMKNLFTKSVEGLRAKFHNPGANIDQPDLPINMSIHTSRTALRR
ncbi:hypothetical protein P280DRAFT_467393 [Massarina eburnea CBS 473.64]|uniref:C2H2-type domain-containing protein n=1 Tax=Massarina eburnea CBS 473.64 TaxID=1395130 RepID=A0A6A6S802_9PLEO|nr:hypothetical protein P280DRAFT_467393 [Massarina eburnea CBS 473.64]